MSNELENIATEVEDLIRKIARIMNKRLRDSLCDSSITPPQFYALVSIYRKDGITIGELCDRMFLACSTVSGLIDRLEKVELVKRYRDQKDRRVVRLTLTEKGLNCTETILDKRRKKLEDDLKMIDIEQQKELINNLNLLLKVMRYAEEE